MKLRIASLIFFVAAIAWAATHTSSLSTDGTNRLMFGLWKTRELLLAGGLLWLALACALAAISKRAMIRFLLANASFGVAWCGLETAGLAGLIDYRAMLNPVAEGHLGTQPVPGANVHGVTREDLASAWGMPSPEIPFHFVADRRGFRNEPDRAEADIYCLGDSFLVAGLVPWEETVTAQFERNTGREVVAFALNGLAPQEECELFRASNLSAKGKLVVQFLFEGNDLLDSASFGSEEGPEQVSLKDRTLTNNLILKLQQWSQPTDDFLALRSGTIDDETYLFRWNRSAFAGFENESERILSSLAQFRGEVEAAGGAYAIVMIPSKIRILGPHCEFPEVSPLADWQAHCSRWPAAVGAWCVNQDIPYLDLTDSLAAAIQEGEMPWFRGDTHWNATGNRVAAEAIADWEFVANWVKSNPGERP